MVASLLDTRDFWFYLTLTRDDQVVQLPLGDFTETGFEAAFDAGIKRFAGGFTKTVALVKPAASPHMMQLGMSGPAFNQLQQVLGEDFNISNEDLSDGSVASEADVLFLAAPHELNDKQLFAIDQFLMRGGTVIASTSPFSVNLANKSLSMQRHQSGLEAWLSESTNVMPQVDSEGRSRYEPSGERGRHLLAAVAQGEFVSYFAGKESPWLEQREGSIDQPENAAAAGDEQPQPADIIRPVIEKSSDAARLIVFASNDFVSDQIMQLAASASGSESLGGLQLMSNTIDWAVEEQGLLSIRSRGHFNRSLPPMAEDEQMLWEGANYLSAVLLVAALALWQRQRLQRRNRRYVEQFTA
jgi:hypothetical protein